MNKTDKILIVVAVILGILLCSKYLTMTIILKLLVGVLTIISLLHWKIMPYKTQLSPRYSAWFSKVDNVMIHVWGLFKNVPKIQLGNNLSMDAAPFIVCGILILILVIL